MQPDPNPYNQDLPATLMVMYFGDVNVLANKVNG